MGLNGFIGQEAPASVVNVVVGDTSMDTACISQHLDKHRGPLDLLLGYGRGANGENIGKAAFQSGESGSFDTDAEGNLIPVGANASWVGSLE